MLHDLLVLTPKTQRDGKIIHKSHVHIIRLPISPLPFHSSPLNCELMLRSLRTAFVSHKTCLYLIQHMIETNKTLLTFTHHGDHLFFFYHPVNIVANTTCFKTYTEKRLTKYLIYKTGKTHVFRRTYSSFNHSPPQEIQKEDKMGSLLIMVAILTSWLRLILNASRRCSD